MMISNMSYLYCEFILMGYFRYMKVEAYFGIPLRPPETVILVILVNMVNLAMDD